MSKRLWTWETRVVWLSFGTTGKSGFRELTCIHQIINSLNQDSYFQIIGWSNFTIYFNFEVSKFLKTGFTCTYRKTTMQGWFPKNQQWKLSSYGSLMFKKPIKISKPKFYQVPTSVLGCVNHVILIFCIWLVQKCAISFFRFPANLSKTIF